jgi:predicted  nucleic acid-binding Zn-ribbon protein
MVEEKCSTMEEDVEAKTRKLKKLMARYQQSKAEITTLRTELQDTIHEFQRERADMFLTLRSLDQQLQLKSFIIEVHITYAQPLRVSLAYE